MRTKQLSPPRTIAMVSPVRCHWCRLLYPTIVCFSVI